MHRLWNIIRNLIEAGKARHDMNPDSHHIFYWAFTHANRISFPNLEFYAMSCLPTTFCSVIIGPDVAARASASGDNIDAVPHYVPAIGH